MKNLIGKLRARLLLRGLMLAGLLLVGAQPLARAAEAPRQGGAQVLEAFDRQQMQRVNEGNGVSDHKKQLIMFALGAPLLVLLLITGGMGVAIGVYGKPWFVTHMIFAGLTITLAIVHVVVGLVWFYPF